MPIQYKIDVLQALKRAGYSSYRLRHDRLMGERIMTLIRAGKLVSWDNISTICALLQCQPGDIMEYIPDNSD